MEKYDGKKSQRSQSCIAELPRRVSSRSPRLPCRSLNFPQRGSFDKFLCIGARGRSCERDRNRRSDNLGLNDHRTRMGQGPKLLIYHCLRSRRIFMTFSLCWSRTLRASCAFSIGKMWVINFLKSNRSESIHSMAFLKSL